MKPFQSEKKKKKKLFMVFKVQCLLTLQEHTLEIKRFHNLKSVISFLPENPNKSIDEIMKCNI